MHKKELYYLSKKQIILFIIAIAFASTLSAQQKGVSSGTSRLTSEQTLHRYGMADLRFSPDGNTIVMTVTEPVEGTDRNRDIWAYDIPNRDLVRLTTSEKSDHRPRWSPDGKILAFLSDRSEKTQVYLLSMRGGEAEALTDSKTGVESFEWSPDGEHIAFLAKIPKTEEEEKREKEKDDARVVDKDEKHAQLWLIHIDSRDVRQLTHEPWRISEYVWAPEGDRLIVSATDHPQPELETNRIYTISLSDGDIKEILFPSQPFRGLSVSRDGSTLAFTGTHADGPTAHDLFIFSLSDGEMRNLTRRTIDRPIGDYAWQKDGSILAQVMTGFTNVFYTISPDGRAKQQKPFDVHPIGAFAVHSKSIAFTGQTTICAPEVWLSRHPGKAEPITRFNEAWDTLHVIQPEIISYSSFDGTEIEASLLKPTDYREGMRLPLIVLVHGGPTGRWSDRFHAWGQLLAHRGFAVLNPNIRGSTGYGYAFMAMNRRDWGGADYKDVMAGVDFLIDQGIADPERLGIGGWSYGGYMAAWAVTQTDRFKASVSGAPMTDLAFEYGSERASINAYDTWFMGTPYENLDLFIQRSPVTHVKHVKTPTLLLCGENDAIDPVEQCHQFYRGLKRYRVDTELVIYPREGHGIREEKHQLDVLNRMIDWFETYVK